MKGFACGFPRENAGEEAFGNAPCRGEESLSIAGPFDDGFQRNVGGFFFSAVQVHLFLNLHDYIYTINVHGCQQEKKYFLYTYTLRRVRNECR